MRNTDVLVIGAGLVGCFTARALARYDIRTVVLEKEPDVCRGISKANTGIVYSGYTTKPGSLRAKLCVQANEDFDRLCGELDVPFKRCGSLMIAYGAEGEASIRKKYRHGLENGIEGLRLVTGEEVRELEPNLAPGVRLGMLAPGTGVINPWELCIAAFENARANGTEFRFREEVKNIRRDGKRFIVGTDGETYEASVLVNAAGHNADKIFEMIEKPAKRIFPNAADYIVLDPRQAGFVSRVILHQAEEGKGLTLVPTLDGNIMVGPSKRPSDGMEGGYVSAEGLKELEKLCRAVVPDLDISDRIRVFGTKRPKAHDVAYVGGAWVGDPESGKDISIVERGGFLSLIGIKTPGLTFSCELGKHVAEKAAALLGSPGEDPRFDPARKGIPRARDMSPEERAEYIREHPSYGRIVCQCMDVTRGEIEEAVRRGAVDVEGVKRRTGACFGRCQGSRCMREIQECLRAEDRPRTGEDGTC